MAPSEVPNPKVMTEVQWLSWLLRILPPDLTVETVQQQRTVRVHTMCIDIVLPEEQR
jgi:hypothetical protein